jgi:general secretion pathway protein A
MQATLISRGWWRRCRPEAARALTAGTLTGLFVWTGTAFLRIPLDSLHLWGKLQLARIASGLGFASLGVEWPTDNGQALLAVGELLRTPGLDAWASTISMEIAGATVPAAVSGALVFAAMLTWQELRLAARSTGASPTETDPAAPRAAAETAPVVAEPLVPVTLPDLPAPPSRMEPVQSLAQEPVTVPMFQQEAPKPSARPRPSSPHAPLPGSLPAGKPGTSYEKYWGLSELPFENVPDPKFYFPAPMHEEALHRLLYGVQTRKGAVMLTGEIGCGKTLLSRELGLHLAGQQYDLAFIANPSFGVEDFLTEVLYQLGIEPTRTKVKLLHLLNERLLENYKKGKQTIVVVDEAQAIPDDLVFEELRLLLNFQLNDRFLLTLVLMGQPELNARVMAIKQFAQRISIKYHLGAFSQEETGKYIVFRLKAARCEREIFTPDALALIFERSGGIPRNINRLCDLCLLIGYMDKAAQVDRAIAERAAADLT